MKTLLACVSFAINVCGFCASALAALDPGYPAAVDKGYVLVNPALPDNAANRAYWKSGLATWQGSPIWDDELASMFTPVARRGTSLGFAFGQCFGGGVLQEVGAISKIGGGTGITIAGASASKWSEAAYYAIPPRNVFVGPGPNNHMYDWVNSFTAGADSNPAFDMTDMANNAWFGDYFGTALPAIAKGPDEVNKRETAQYRETAAGAGLLYTLTEKPAANRHAVLYAGKPDGFKGRLLNPPPGVLIPPYLTADRDEIVAMWNLLVDKFDYNPSNISVLFGDGTLANAPANMMGRIFPATSQSMQLVVNNLLTPIIGDGVDGSHQVFMLAADHGTARNPLMPANRWLEVPRDPIEGWSPSSGSPGDQDGLDRFAVPSEWEASVYYVPEPAGMLLLAGTMPAWVALRSKATRRHS